MPRLIGGAPRVSHRIVGSSVKTAIAAEDSPSAGWAMDDFACGDVSTTKKDTCQYISHKSMSA